MNSKYSKEEISDITKPFIQNGPDADFIQKKMYERFQYPLPEKIYLQNKRENSDHGVIDAKALKEFGEHLLNNNLYAATNAYNLIIPSVNVVGGNHSVALMTDCQSQNIWYQDSLGSEMRQEMKDFLKQIFPDYKINCFTQIQQDAAKDDKSCYLLAEYNILDMWHRKNNHLDLVKEFSSEEARTAVWEIVKQIEAVPAKKIVKAPKRSFKMRNDVLSKKYLLQCQRNSYRDFKYRLTQEKNYKDLIKKAAQKAISAHLLYKQGLIDLNVLSR